MSYANDSSLPLFSTGTLYGKLLRITLFHQIIENKMIMDQ